MYPHQSPLLATFCINTPNSSYSCVFTVAFWPALCDSVSFMFFLVQFPIKFFKSIYFFSFCCLSLPLSVSLLICALWLIDLGINCRIFFLFLKGRAPNASPDPLYIWFSHCPHRIYTVLPGRYLSVDTGANFLCVWKLLWDASVIILDGNDDLCHCN